MRARMFVPFLPRVLETWQCFQQKQENFGACGLSAKLCAFQNLRDEILPRSQPVKQDTEAPMCPAECGRNQKRHALLVSCFAGEIFSSFNLRTNPWKPQENFQVQAVWMSVGIFLHFCKCQGFGRMMCIHNLCHLSLS